MYDRQGRGGRGGRGRGNAGRGKFNRKKGKSYKEYDRDLKFRPHGSGRDKQTVTYTKVIETILLNIQRQYKSGGDIVKAIRDMKHIDMKKEMPKRKLAKIEDYYESEEEEYKDSMTEEVTEAAEEKSSDEGKAKEEVVDPVLQEIWRKSTQEMNDKLYEKMLEEWLERKRQYKENTLKAYAYIYGNYCSKAMQIAIQELPNYESEIQDDPIKLLESVQVLMHTPIRAVYPMWGLAEILADLVNLRQKEDEDLITYLERFKQERNLAKSQLGYGFLDKFMENTKEYQESSSEERETIKYEAFDRMMAVLFIRGSNQGIYGKMTEGFRMQYSLGNNQYPKDLSAAISV